MSCLRCFCFVQNKLTQQDHLTKQLRKKQKELKENSDALTNQKTNFLVSYTQYPKIIMSTIFLRIVYCLFSSSLLQHLQALLNMKARLSNVETSLGGASIPNSRSQSAAADGRGSAAGGSRGSAGMSGADHKAAYESYTPAYAEYSRDSRDAKGGGSGSDYMSFENEGYD